MTGACIYQWKFSSHSLEQVECDFVYLRPSQEDRYPPSGSFGPGEFAEFLYEKAGQSSDSKSSGNPTYIYNDNRGSRMEKKTQINLLNGHCQVGAIGNTNDINNVTFQQLNGGSQSEQGLTQDQVIELLGQLESVLKHPELPGEVQTKAIRYLEAAKEEVQAEKPDKQLTAASLKRMQEIIESTSKTMESGKKIWETTKPVLEALLPWLGVAKTFFGF